MTTRLPQLVWGIVVTPHPYSLLGVPFQAVVPLYVGMKRMHLPDFMLPAATPWRESLGGPEESMVGVAVSDTLNTRHENCLPGPANAVCDTPLMEMIDAALMKWFDVPLSTRVRGVGATDEHAGGPTLGGELAD